MYVTRKLKFWKIITNTEAYITSRMEQVPFCFLLTLISNFQVNLLKFYLICKYLKWWQILQILLLSTNRKSCIYLQMVPLWMLYIMTLTNIFKVKQFENVESKRTNFNQDFYKCWYSPLKGNILMLNFKTLNFFQR